MFVRKGPTSKEAKLASALKYIANPGVDILDA